jgi:hypothetical protein
MSTDKHTDELRAEVEGDRGETAAARADKADVKTRAKEAGRHAVAKARETTSQPVDGNLVITGMAVTALAVWLWLRRRAPRPPTRMELAAQTAALVRERAAELSTAAAHSDTAARARALAGTPENTLRAQGAAAVMALLFMMKLLRRRA